MTKIIRKMKNIIGITIGITIGNKYLNTKIIAMITIKGSIVNKFNY